MTFGEKLKKARKDSHLSQEQLADKIGVSRSTVTKWETDRGLPDIDNLRAIAQLVNVSIDYLLDGDKVINFDTMSEPIELSQYTPTGKCRTKQDAVCFCKNKDATAIYALYRYRKMNKAEWLIDFIVLPGIVDLLDEVSEIASHYLVEKSDRQYLVKVTKGLITTTELTTRVDVKKFIVVKHKYKKLYQIV